MVRFVELTPLHLPPGSKRYFCFAGGAMLTPLPTGGTQVHIAGTSTEVLETVEKIAALAAEEIRAAKLPRK